MLYSVQRVNSLLAINWTAISINSDSCYTHHCQFLSWLGLKKQFPHCLSTDSIGVCFLRSLYSSAKKKQKKNRLQFRFQLVYKNSYLDIMYFNCIYSELFLLRFHEWNTFTCTTKHFTHSTDAVCSIMTRFNRLIFYVHMQKWQMCIT